MAVLVIAGVVMVADHLKLVRSKAAAPFVVTNQPATQTTAAASQPATPNSTSGDPSASPANSSGYKDGSFTATSGYYVPHSTESIEVSLTLSGGVIKDVSIQNSENDFTSAQFQEDFAASYKHYVVGKKISGLQLDTVAGASDTTSGFNNALSQIASQAHA